MFWLSSAVKYDPVLNNLPATVDFDEMIASGSFLFNVRVEDPDVDDNHTFSMQVEPDTATHMFVLETNSE